MIFIVYKIYINLFFRLFIIYLPDAQNINVFNLVLFT